MPPVVVDPGAPPVEPVVPPTLEPATPPPDVVELVADETAVDVEPAPPAPAPPAPLEVAAAVVDVASVVVAPPQAKTAPTPAATNLSRHEFTVSSE
jgi:hypothetical protein